MAEKKYVNFIQDGDFKYNDYLKDFGKKYVGATLILIIAFVIFIYFAGTSLLNIYGEISDVLTRNSYRFQGFIGLLQNHKADMIFILVLAILLSYIASVISLKTLKIIGATFLWIMTILTFTFSIFMVYQIKNYMEYAWVFLIIAFIPVILLAVFWKNLKIAARLITLTSDMLLKDWRILLNGLIYGGITLLLTLGINIIYIDNFIYLREKSLEEIVIEFQTTDFSTSWFVVIMTLLYYFLMQYTYNFYYGAVIAEAHAFYRGESIAKADGFRVVIRRLRAIVVYSAFSSIIYLVQWFLRQLAKRSKDFEKLNSLGIKVVLKPGQIGTLINKKSLMQLIANWAIRMLEKIWLMINFFTLPAIVVENLSAKDAIKKSFNYMRTKLVNIFIRKTAVRHAFRFATFLMLLFSGVGGAVLGVLLKEYFSISTRTAAIFFGILFLLVSGIPAWMMSKNLDVVYLTFLYCYQLDDELKKYGVGEIPSVFFGFKKKERKKSHIIHSKKKRAVAYFAIFVAIISCLFPVYSIYTLYVQDYAIVSNFNQLNIWLQKMSFATGYGVIVLIFSLLLLMIARRRITLVFSLISMLIGLSCVLYIDYWRPLDWTPELFDSFQMIVFILNAGYVVVFLIGFIIEASLIGMEINEERDEKLINDLAQAVAESKPEVNAAG
ncbi:MAG: hypothetical protein ACTSVI_01260 [Promethearchaeota archaeon]